jgi:chemotaxis protein methyltransferase CheR
MEQLSQHEVEYFITETIKISEYDFTGYSIKSFTRRLEKILTDNNMTMSALFSKMERNRKFLEYVVKEITVNTTEPFRTPPLWLSLIPIMRQKFTALDSINIWHAGCSTGQELYSMLILLYEMGLFHKVKIFGSDLNEDVLEVARSGKYRFHDFDEYWDNFKQVMAGFPNFKVDTYLDVNQRRGIVKVNSFLVEKPTFVKHNLIKDGNIFGVQFDMIMCRNVLIYFDHDLQDKVFKFFYESLTTEGTLVIGKHESILGPIQRKFERIDSIYMRKKEDNSWNF